MKKTSFLLIGSLIILSACKRSYICNCATETGVYTKDTKLSRTTYSKKKAKTYCASLSEPNESCFPVYNK